ncbi:2-succinyl-5-enolpyruvyl-6-hydroxy-3-cyclohexene-1-carboxylic-acid synthase [Clostridium sporogenes]|uniref:2-succinyl-5-enolpyruvyl-6-hydroxy-3- cyclohexene-1-carboxylic-acid synthase n=1 Tax=unclassified Clostridium TaxID=2614128 RepID=UPI0013CF6635|nr:2-succinyl-5-enolpyruvyl-6-hydroxy-3-cyclohexene-1-carboxylic-acid synthase [Clostridium sporogenes]NFS25379.1 2-succinyl-5-enolpyruvyl-6-hydroxy-3-cyclohexene-1-carboxylic-acid synthase [Clostridium sporogenes]
MTNYIAALVDELYLLDIRHVVISPGSRSTPLAMVFCEENFKTYINIDERSAGFFALGIAKEIKQPTILLCTSGTAACNYLPAITEASVSNVPLIVITSDRPYELRNVGAPQTINQNNIYSNFVKAYEELGLPEENETAYLYVRTAIDRAYTKAITKPYGVVHINIPLREPLIPDFETLDFSLGRRRYSYNFKEFNRKCNIDFEFFKNKTGIIICGADSNADYFSEVIALSERVKAPVLADPISNFRSFKSENIIYTYDSILKNESLFESLKVDYVIHFGGISVSKSLNDFIKFNSDIRYFKVSSEFNYVNPTLSITDYIMASEKSFTNSISFINSNSEYLRKWIELQDEYSNITDLVISEKALFEGKIIKIMEDLMEKHTRLFVSNSMSIRYIDSYFSDKYKKNIKVLCNRGANGIDGVVSSALGVSKVSKNTVLFIGDLAFYHDLNGLLAGKIEKSNLVIVLLNNNGGGIFRYLPQSSERNFEYLFLTQHGIDFKATADLYNLKYELIGSYERFETSFKNAINSKGINLLEVKIDSKLSKEMHFKYTKLEENHAD